MVWWFGNKQKDIKAVAAGGRTLRARYSDTTTAVTVMPDVNFQFYTPATEYLEASANCLCMGVISFGGYDVLIMVNPRELTIK